jgi:hypothetical protein
MFYTIWILYYASYQNGFEIFFGGLSKKGNPLTVLKEASIGLDTLQSSHLSIVVLISAMILFYKRKFSWSQLNQQQYIFIILIIWLTLRYMMFPDFSTRFFLPVYIMCPVLALEAIAEWRSENPQPEGR